MVYQYTLIQDCVPRVLFLNISDCYYGPTESYYTLFFELLVHCQPSYQNFRQESGDFPCWSRIRFMRAWWPTF